MTASDLWHNVFNPLCELYEDDEQVIIDFSLHRPDMPSASFDFGTNLVTFTVEPAPTPESVEHCLVTFTPNPRVTDHLVFDVENDTVSAFGVVNIPFKMSGTIHKLMFFCTWPGQYIQAVEEILDVIIPIIELSRA
jgi:hypothetical protein